MPRSRSRHGFRFLTVALLLASACSKKDPAPPVDPRYARAECDNLNPEACLFPWPSDRYLVADATSRTGYRVSIPQAAMPGADPEVPGTGADPADFNRWD